VFDHTFHDIFGPHFTHIFGQQTRQPRNKNMRIVMEMEFLDTLQDQTKSFEIKLTNGTDKLEVVIPCGIQDGQAISIRGRGDNEFVGHPRGNLEIVFRVKPHPKFTKQDDNVLTDVTIDCFEAVLGTDLELETPSSRRISMRIPAGTQTGTIFGVTDEGFPNHNKTARGKLLVRINVLIPKTLTPEQILLVKEIQKIKPVNS